MGEERIKFQTGTKQKQLKATCVKKLLNNLNSYWSLSNLKLVFVQNINFCSELT